VSDRELLTECLDVLTHDAAQRTFAGGVRMSQLAIKLRAHLAAPSEDIETLRRDAERLKADNERLRDALKLALNSHGRMLLTDPPQDPWKVNRVDEVIRELLQEVPR
jgi:hypothetical protein